MVLGAKSKANYAVLWLIFRIFPIALYLMTPFLLTYFPITPKLYIGAKNENTKNCVLAMLGSYTNAVA